MSAARRVPTPTAGEVGADGGGGDALTLLLASERTPLRKVWTSLTEKPRPAAIPWLFRPECGDVVHVDGVKALSALLTTLEQSRNGALIRGRFIGAQAADARMAQALAEKNAARRAGGLAPVKAEPGWYPRTGRFYEDQPLHSFMIDVDGFTPQGDPLADPAAAFDEFIEKTLPACFHGMSYHWQLSGSAGHPTCENVLKGHIWGWLAVPRTSGQLRVWGSEIEGVCVFQPIVDGISG